MDPSGPGQTPVGGENLFEKIVYRDVSKIAKNSFLLVLANTILIPIVSGAYSVVFGSLFRTPTISPLELVIPVLTTIYAGIVYLWVGSRQSPRLGRHFLALGVLGLLDGGALFSFASYRYFSGGYWLGQLRSDRPRCGADGGSVVVYGTDGLACSKESHLIKVGYDIPRAWRRVGMAGLAVGLGIVVIGSLVSSLASFAYVILGVGYVLLFDGFIFSFSSFFQHGTYGSDYVRLPEKSESSGPAKSS
jgi:hypothetical protein